MIDWFPSTYMILNNLYLGQRSISTGASQYLLLLWCWLRGQIQVTQGRLEESCDLHPGDNRCSRHKNSSAAYKSHISRQTNDHNDTEIAKPKVYIHSYPCCNNSSACCCIDQHCTRVVVQQCSERWSGDRCQTTGATSNRILVGCVRSRCHSVCGVWGAGRSFLISHLSQMAGTLSPTCCLCILATHGRFQSEWT
jgi:hypothetical protein